MMYLKLLPYIAALVAGIGIGTFGTIKIAKLTAPVVKCPEVVIPPCPPCPTAVSLQSFDLSKLNNKKGNFTYAPSLSDVTVVLDCQDSVLLKQMLNQAKGK